MVNPMQKECKRLVSDWDMRMGNGAIVQLKVIFYSPFTNGLQRDFLSAFAFVVRVWHFIPLIGGALPLSLGVVRCGFAN